MKVAVGDRLLRFERQFRRRYRRRQRTKQAARLFDIGSLSKDAAYKAYRNEIRTYWRDHYGRPVDPVWHLICAKATGVKDVRFVPTHEWFEDILPFFNDLPLRPAFRDKNLSDVFLNCARTPQTIFKRMHGRYYAGDNMPLSRSAAEQRLTAGGEDLIVKPSQTDDGYGIRSLVANGSKLLLNGVPCTLRDLESQYGHNFLVQERITQHPLMAKIHPNSVNTVRTVTFRWKDEIRILAAFARFGSQGRLTDNAGTGGLCCGIDEQGRLNDSAVDARGTVYTAHPTTGYAFTNGIFIPNYDSVCKLALDLHRQIFHFDIVSWDFAIDFGGEPVFLEVNFQGTVHVYQFACRRPLFGDLTDDVLEAIRDSRS